MYIILKSTFTLYSVEFTHCSVEISCMHELSDKLVELAIKCYKFCKQAMPIQLSATQH